MASLSISWQKPPFRFQHRILIVSQVIQQPQGNKEEAANHPVREKLFFVQDFICIWQSCYVRFRSDAATWLPVLEQSCFLLENRSAYFAALENGWPRVQTSPMSQLFQYNCSQILPSYSLGAIPHCIRGESHCFSENVPLILKVSLGSSHSSPQILLVSQVYLPGICQEFQKALGILYPSLISIVGISFPHFFCVCLFQ